MPVLPCLTSFSLDYKKLYQFLLACQQKCLLNSCQQFVSIPMAIEQVDPLVVFENIAQVEQLNFYFEHKGKQEATAAMDAIAQLHLQGKNRFSKVQDFIKSCQAKTVIFSNLNNIALPPRFFCSFSFFDENGGNYPFPAATVFLPRWQITKCIDFCVLVANLVIDAKTNLELLLDDLQNNIQNILSLDGRLNKYHLPGKLIKKEVSNIDRFKQTILSALESIQQKKLDKIVLAQTLDVLSDKDFSLYNSLNNLRQIHPNCYVFSTSNGKGQNFIGASPERLISIRDRQLVIDALAGSAPRGKTATEDADLANLLLNSDKEKREHKVVIDFITQHLQALGIEANILTPRLRQLCNIQHLWTPIEAKIPVNVHPLEIVAQLHPTPAVAGVSRDLACAEIRRYEDFERGLYAAPLGWVDYQGNSEFIVGIRSALIDGDRARLYAGAGIVKGSDPDKELAEIQLKLQALLKALV